MTVNISTIELAFANLLDLIPMISNTDEDVDPALIRIYERNAAIVNEEWDVLVKETFVKLGSFIIPPSQLKIIFPISIYYASFQGKSIY